MTVREQVLQAKTPRDALLVLADAIDALSTQPADPWSEWDDTDTHKEVNDQLRIVAAIDAAQHNLQESTDPEEIRALEATIRLLKDELREIKAVDDSEGEQQRARKTTGEDGRVMYDLPVASEEDQAVRRQFAEKCLKLQDEFGPEIVESYVKGGPLVLYYTDRDFVMRMPEQYRKAMVADVEKFSPNEAQEMGRDVLKDMTPDGARDVTMEVLSNAR